VAAFTGAYHGMTAGALAVSGGVAAKTAMSGAAAEALRLPFPYAYRCPFGVGGGSTAELSARYVERLLDDPNGGVLAPAAVILEVVQGEGGVVPAPHDWLREVRRITADRDVPLVVDEVQTGVGRTGTFWACEGAGVEPDVMVLSKAVGGTLPLAAVVYADHLDTWEPGAHAGTFRGTTLAMAAGAATLRHVRREDLSTRAAEVGDRMLRELRSLAEVHPCLGDVRGRGLMLGVEFDTAEHAEEVQWAAFQRGLLVLECGKSSVRMSPALTVTEDEMATALRIFAESVAAVAGEASDRPILHAAEAAHAMTGMESSG
jgi:diaminobutyrate-2-oxoglutarate transaminase